MAVDLAQVSQERLWGLTYRVFVLNQDIAAANARAEEFNAHKSPSVPEQPLQELWTEQSYADHLFNSQADSAYAELVSEKERRFKLGFLEADPAVQSQVQTLLGVQDVIPTA